MYEYRCLALEREEKHYSIGSPTMAAMYLSPETWICSLGGAPTSARSAETATGSVADNI
jgi:hypothetical protein